MSRFQHPHGGRAAQLERLQAALGVDPARLAIIRLADRVQPNTFTTDDVAKALRLTYRTAQRHVSALHAAGILRDVDGTQPGQKAPGKARNYLLDNRGRQKLLAELKSAVTHRAR